MLEIKQAYEVRINGDILLYLPVDMKLYKARAAILMAAMEYPDNADGITPLLQGMKDKETKQPYCTVGEYLKTV